jgi:hypothetical protein
MGSEFLKASKGMLFIDGNEFPVESFEITIKPDRPIGCAEIYIPRICSVSGTFTVNWYADPVVEWSCRPTNLHDALATIRPFVPRPRRLIGWLFPESN